MKIKLTHPLISCICITDSRPQMLLKAIVSFNNQDYPNKELVISYPEKDKATKDMLDKIVQFIEQRLIIIERSDEISLGKAKNEAISKCNGEYVCLWDDDDLHHPMRVKFQYNNMQVNGQYREACILTRVLLYDSTTGIAYQSFHLFWDGTLLCKKDLVLQTPFSDSNKDENDTLIQYLDSKKLIHQVPDFPSLYIFVYHGQNAVNYNRFESFFERSDLLDQRTLDWVSSQVNIQFQLPQ